MNLFKDKNGKLYGFSDEDLENLAKNGVDVIKNYELTPFSYTDEEIVAQEQERLKQQQIAEAHSLLSRSIKLESGVYQRRMSAEQQAEFVLWQDLLLEFIKNERQDLPPTPEFINQLLEEL